MNPKPESPRFVLILGSLFLLAYAAYNVGAAWMDTVPENAARLTPTPTLSPTITLTPTITPTPVPLYWITPTFVPGEARPTPKPTSTPLEAPPVLTPTATSIPPTQTPAETSPTLSLTPSPTSDGGGYPGPIATPTSPSGATETPNPYPGVPTATLDLTGTPNPYPGVPTATSGFTETPNPYPGVPTATPTTGGAETPTFTPTLTPSLQPTTSPGTPTATPPLPSATAPPVDTLPYEQVSALTNGSVNQVVWSADGGSLLLATSQGLYLYEVGDWGEATILDAGNAIRSAQYASDGALLVTGDADATIRWWELDTHKYLGDLTGHLLGIVRLGLPNFGNFLVSGSDDATVRVWDISTLTNLGVNSVRVLFTFTEPVTRVTDLAVSANGNLTAAASQRHVHIWHPLTGELRKDLRQPDGWYTALAFNPDNQTLVTAYDGRRLEFWDIATWQRTKFIPLDGPVRVLTYSPDGRFLAVGYEDGRLQIRDAHTKALLADLAGHPDLSSAAFDATSTQLVTSSLDGTLRIWNLSQIRNP